MARRHQLDLLPLLDVFMVVLFVFATIQEQRLDDTTRDAAQLEQQLAEASRTLDDVAARERQQKAQAAAIDRQQAVVRAEAQREADQLRRELQALQQRSTEEHEKTRTLLAEAGLPEQMLEHLELLSRVLEKYSVFEIELVGERGEHGEVINRCCYRVDPLLDQWRACGVVPLLPEDRERWLDEGANGLAEALRRTKGGNAMTLLRQDHAASHRIAEGLAGLLRTRFSDQYVDFEDVPELTVRCAP
jgi:biopolymer transport protein ExbD